MGSDEKRCIITNTTFRYINNNKNAVQEICMFDSVQSKYFHNKETIFK